MARKEARPRPAWYIVEEQKRRCSCCRRMPVRFCCAWICFALLLSFLASMTHPAFLRSSSIIGFQAFQSVISPIVAVPGKGETGEKIDIATSTTSTGGFGPSYPLDVYAPQVPNSVPLTEITVMSCLPSWLWKCKPLTTAEKDARLGPWVLVDRPLDADTAATKADPSGGLGLASLDYLGHMLAAFETKYVFYRRSRRSDVPRVVDMRLVQTGVDDRPVGGDFAGWHRVKTDIRTTVMTLEAAKRPVHLYYRTVGGNELDHDGEEGMNSNLKPEDVRLDSDPITEIDVTYGSGPAWPGFQPVGIVAERQEDLKVAQVTLTVRRTPALKPATPADPPFRQDGTFKILQLADLHYSVRHEKCRDVDWESPSKPCVADNDTVAMIERWLDAEKPDMVVFSGDQLNGQGTSWDEKSVIPKWVKPVIDRKIPWASIQGNHDSQAGLLSRPEQQALLSHLPYSYTRVGPARLHDGEGAGNFYVKLRSPKPDGIHLFTLYFLDSGQYAPRDTWHPFSFNGYDWVRKDQIDWLLDISKQVKGIERPYQGDGGKDLGPIWRRDDLPVTKPAKADQAPYLSKPKAMLFVHIPVPEAFATADTDQAGKPLSFGVMQEESTTQGAQKEKGLYDALLARPKEEQDVVALLHGHMHNNAGCRRVRTIWTCFNGGSSFAGYGKNGLERRARVLQISTWGQKITTWQVHERTAGRQEEHVIFEESRPLA